MDFICVQLLVLSLLLLGSFLFGTLPVLVFRYFKCFIGGGNRVISFLVFFGGGVLMSTCFLHLLPESRAYFSSRKQYRDTRNVSTLNGGRSASVVDSSHPDAHSHDSFPIPEFLVLCGLFLTYFIEVVIHSLFLHSSDHAQMGIKMCTCAQRDTECSRPYKDLKPDTSLFATEKKTKELDASTHLQPNTLQQNYGSLDAGPSAAPALGNNPETPIVKDVEPVAFKNTKTSLTSLFTVCALSFHSVLEGFALGFQRTALDTWTLFLAVALHKYVISFVIGVEVMSQSSPFSVLLSYMLVFACMSPIGMAGAMFTDIQLASDSSMVLGIINSLTTGTLLYVTFFEILRRKTCLPFHGWGKFTAITLGAGFMSMVLYFTVLL